MLRTSPWRVSLNVPSGNRTTSGARLRRRLSTTSRAVAMVAVASLGLIGMLGITSTAGAAVAPATPTTVVAPPIGGVLTGNVVIRNAPAYFQGEVGVAVCPATATPTKLCASPLDSVAFSGASYSLNLPAGAWEVHEFYTIGYGGGGAYIGRPHAITIANGQTLRQNIGVQYQVPTSVAGTVTITGVPIGVAIADLQVTACPSSQPLSGGFPSIFCSTQYVEGTDQYSIPTLFKGHWLLYVGYDTVFGFTQLTVPTPVTLPKGGSVTADLSGAYQTPTNGALEGTVTITGAPAGFAPGFEGVGACPAGGPPGVVCPNPQYTLGGGTSGYALPLTPGQWGAAGFYELAGFGGQFISTVQTVTVAAGVIDQVNFTVPYVAPATVKATVTVTGVPLGTTIEETELLACPSNSPFTGGNTPIECVSAYGIGAMDTISTLPPGKWLLYPGYFASNGNFFQSTQATAVKLKAGKTKRRILTVAYQP
jgi:hypothetical protein